MEKTALTTNNSSLTTIKKGYRNTEIGVIPMEWEVVKLDDVVDFLDGQRRPIKANERKSGIYPYYGASGIIDYVNDYIFDDDLILLGEDGENILSRNLPLAFQVGGKIWVNNHAHVLKPKKNIIIGFLTDYLESLDYVLLNSGTAQPKLNKQACVNLKVIVPPLPEQTAIATVLSDTDNLLQALQKKIAKKQAIKKGAMQVLLKPKEGWVVKTLGEVCDVLDNLRIPLNSKQRDEMKGNIPYCGANGVVDYVNDFVVDDEILLMAEDGGYFDEFETRPIAYKIKGKCWVNNHVHILKAKNNYCQDFIYFSIVHKNILDYINGGTRAKLNKGDLIKIEITMPSSKQEQTRIAQILSDMDTEIEALEKQLAKYKQVKQGLMQVLLTGKIRLV